MKQEVLTNGHHKASPPATPSTVARIRAARTKDSTRKESPNGASPGAKAGRTRTAALESNSAKVVSKDMEEAAPRRRLANRAAVPVAEQYTHVRHRPEAECQGNEHEGGKNRELQIRLETSEMMVRELQTEVVGLKTQIQKLQVLNCELEEQKRRLGQDLLAAHDRIKQLEKSRQEVQPPGVRYAQKSIASNLSEQFKVKEAIRESGNSKLPSVAMQPAMPKIANTKPPSPPPAPSAALARAPPPPPPPPRQGPAKMSTVSKAAALVELYNSLTKRDAKKAAVVGDVAISPHHNSIVGELQNRSTHLLAIKTDVETKGEFINSLISKVQTTAYTDMEDVLTFVDWLDRELSTLSDETAVLKHFNWPERKADALREAAFEYRDLKCVLSEVSSFNDDGTPTSCEATLRKISNLLDKLEKSMTGLISLRNSAMISYKEFRIPTDWMLDSGIASKIKLASVKLAKMYMKRVLQELGTSRNSEREMANEALVAQSVRFAYKAHQFAGGLDAEAMRAFEELRERVRSQGRGSKVPLPSTMLPQ